MKPIRIIDTSFNLLAEIDDYESLVWIRRWHIYGDFQMQININKNNTNVLQKGNIVLFGNYPGVILHREIKVDENGKGGETLKIKGYSLASILARRITVPPIGCGYDVVNDYAEGAIKHYVDFNAVNPIDTQRRIPQLVIAPNQNRGANIKYQTRYKPLDEEIKAISLYSGLGWDITVDLINKNWIFDVLEGKGLTTSQSINNPVIFSIDFDNIKSQQYIDSDLGYKNHAYIGGQGEGALRTIAETGEGLTGLDRVETFIDARDIENEADLIPRGQQKLAQYAQIKSFESEILTKGPFEYQKDWNLGDIVNIVNPKWGISLETRITEVKEIWEPNGFKLEATFGNSIPTLIDKIKQEISSYKEEMVR